MARQANAVRVTVRRTAAAFLPATADALRTKPINEGFTVVLHVLDEVLATIARMPHEDGRLVRRRLVGNRCRLVSVHLLPSTPALVETDNVVAVEAGLLVVAHILIRSTKTEESHATSSSLRLGKAPARISGTASSRRGHTTVANALHELRTVPGFT